MQPLIHHDASDAMPPPKSYDIMLSISDNSWHHATSENLWHYTTYDSSWHHAPSESSWHHGHLWYIKTPCHLWYLERLITLSLLTICMMTLLTPLATIILLPLHAAIFPLPLLPLLLWHLMCFHSPKTICYYIRLRHLQHIVSVQRLSIHSESAWHLDQCLWHIRRQISHASFSKCQQNCGSSLKLL